MKQPTELPSITAKSLTPTNPTLFFKSVNKKEFPHTLSSLDGVQVKISKTDLCSVDSRQPKFAASDSDPFEEEFNLQDPSFSRQATPDTSRTRHTPTPIAWGFTPSRTGKASPISSAYNAFSTSPYEFPPHLQFSNDDSKTTPAISPRSREARFAITKSPCILPPLANAPSSTPPLPNRMTPSRSSLFFNAGEALVYRDMSAPATLDPK